MKENISLNQVNPDDERTIKQGQKNLYEEAHAVDEEDKGGISLYDHLSDEDIKTEHGKDADNTIGVIFGLRTALGLIALQWRYKDQALKFIMKQLKPTLDEEPEDTPNVVKACLIAVNITLTDKVVKVATSSIALLSTLIKQKEILDQGMDYFIKVVLHFDIMNKLIWKAEEGNTRL
jgi:hypothetical protein